MAPRHREGEFYGEIIRSTRANGLSLTEARYAPGFRTPSHSHEQPYFCLVLDGVSVQSYGKQKRLLGPLSSYFCPAGEVHAETLEKGRGHEFIIGFNSAWLARLEAYSTSPEVSVAFDGGLPAWLAKRAYDEFLHADGASPLAIEGLALELLAVVSRRNPDVVGGRAPRWLLAAKQMLHERFTETLSLSEIAGAVHVHPLHLAREFRRWYLTTVGDYVRKLRIEFARDAIINTNTPLITIAHTAGFSDHSHFTRTFKRLTGMTPSEFRATTKRR